jgi:hypothetical protein
VGLAGCNKAARQSRALSAEELNHAFDRHGRELFGRAVSREGDFGRFRSLVDRARASGLTLSSRVGASETFAHLARVDGKYVVVHFFSDGPDAGKLASVFHPNQKQLGHLLEGASRHGP